MLMSSSVCASNHIRSIDVQDICTTRTAVYRNVPQSLKAKVYARDGVPAGNHTGICAGVDGCEVDHRVSLQLGGSNDISNLMIQPFVGDCNARHKDHLENKLHAMVCSGALSITDAQQIIYDDWEAGYRQFIDRDGCR